MKRTFLLTIAFLLPFLPLSGQCRAEMWVYGIGTISCEKLIQSVDTGVPGPELNLIVLSWVQGYVSAMSGWIEPMDKTSSNEITYSLDKYCRGNPSETIQVAADNIVGQLWIDNQKRNKP
ncbi:MAG TPA: hypothetical protein DEQ20_00875 [Desulfobulbaceae bacterium]|nr:MAG: hypothetical protein A2520_06095 [Deltaproteobacteria bacterium RIFOXYD12_FULL_53_23]HCC53470.1 hypothetical protein [Desulfobulbaceae bacterium]